MMTGMFRLKAILLFSAACAFALSPLINPGFRGFAPDQFPVPQIDPPIKPAGYVFSIWGLIYPWLLAGTGYGLLNRADDAGWDAHRWPLMASLVLGATWLPVAQTSPLWATILIWAMLASALWALARTGGRERLWQRAPIAVYAGWLTAASCVALALMLAGHGVMGAQTAALAALALALALASMVLMAQPGAPEYGLAVIWALVGIAVANLDPLNAPVLGLALAGIAWLAGLSWHNGRRASG